MTRWVKNCGVVVLFLGALSGSPSVTSAASRVISIIPRPVHIEVQDGDFRLTPATAIVAGKALAFDGRQLSAMLSPATGFALQVAETAKAGVPVIELQLDASLE